MGNVVPDTGDLLPDPPRPVPIGNGSAGMVMPPGTLVDVSDIPGFTPPVMVPSNAGHMGSTLGAPPQRPVPQAHAYNAQFQAQVDQEVRARLATQADAVQEMTRKGQILAQRQNQLGLVQQSLQEQHAFIQAWRDGGRLEALDTMGLVWQYNEANRTWKRLSNLREDI